MSVCQVQQQLAAAPLGEERCLLLVHNIDGQTMRNTRVQTLLFESAMLPQVQVVASVDHIHAPLCTSRVCLSVCCGTIVVPFMANTIWVDCAKVPFSTF